MPVRVFLCESGLFCASPGFFVLGDFLRVWGWTTLPLCNKLRIPPHESQAGHWTGAWRISTQLLQVYGSNVSMVLPQFSTPSCLHNRQREVRYKSKVRCTVVLRETLREYLASCPTNPSSIWQESHSGDSCHSTRAASSCMNLNV